MKRFWTDADFPNLSWHDNSVHAFRVIEGKNGVGELVLDIDHIVEWIESEKRYDFRVAPAELRFRDVADLRMTLDYPATSAALAAAKKAAEGGNFDQAVAQSKEAEALAKASSFQATSEKTLWKDLEIR